MQLHIRLPFSTLGVERELTHVLVSIDCLHRWQWRQTLEFRERIDVILPCSLGGGHASLMQQWTDSNRCKLLKAVIGVETPGDQQTNCCYCDILPPIPKH